MSRRSTPVRWLAAAMAALVLHGLVALALLSVRPTLPAAPEPRIFEVALVAPVARPSRPLRNRPQTARAPARGPGVLSAPSGERAPLTPSVVSRDVPDADQAAEARMRAALRARVGCASPEAWGLTRNERDACLERLAQGAAEAAYRPPVIADDKQRAFDAAAARKAAYRAYKDSTTPPLGIDTTGGGPVMNPLPDP